MKKIVHIVLFFAVMANAANMVAVLEITPSSDDAKIKDYNNGVNLHTPMLLTPEVLMEMEGSL